MPSRSAEKMPALETRISSRPKCSTISLKRGLDLVLVADIDGDGDRIAAGLADVVDGLPWRLGVPVENRDLAAFLGKPLGGRLADTGAGTGDRGDLALQASHAISSLTRCEASIQRQAITSARNNIVSE